MKIVVDTSILIDYLRGGKRGAKFIEEIEGNIELFVPTIVIFELFSGKSSTNPLIASRILKLLSFFQRIDLDEKIAKIAGSLYRDINRTLQVPDYLIAASSLEIGASIVTLNQKHFEQIPNLSIYPLTQ